MLDVLIAIQFNADEDDDADDDLVDVFPICPMTLPKEVCLYVNCMGRRLAHWQTLSSVQ